MSSNDIAVSVRGLSKSYSIAHNAEKHTTLGEMIMHRLRRPIERTERETFWALRDVSFDIKKGDVVGIIGRNGAGKSTLLKILSRITEPTSGAIDLYGRVGSLLEVGTGFHPELTGRENIYLNGAILGMKRSEITRQFDAIVDFSGTEKFLDTPVKRYSSGMYVRLAFAVAAHLNPEILIVDEVLAVGDSEFQKKCLGKMQDVASTGRTVIFVSHNMGAVKHLCNISALFRLGELCFMGETEKVIENYMGEDLCNTNGFYLLYNHPGRLSKYEATIQHLTLRNEKGIATSTYTPDESVLVEIFIDPKRLIAEPRVAVAIENAYGYRITSMASHFAKSNLTLIDRPTIIKCHIPKLSLGSGRYLMSVSIGDKYIGLLDVIDGAVSFDVEWNNNYGNGEVYMSVYGPMLSDSSWHQVNAWEKNV